jgi:hypothetical protein
MGFINRSGEMLRCSADVQRVRVLWTVRIGISDGEVRVPADPTPTIPSYPKRRNL